MAAKLTAKKRDALLIVQFTAVAVLIWSMYGSVVEGVLAGGLTVVLMYVLFLRTE